MKSPTDAQRSAPYPGYVVPEPLGRGCLLLLLAILAATIACLVGGAIALIEWIAS